MFQVPPNVAYMLTFKVILYSYLILKKMNERITGRQYINKYTMNV